MQTTADHSSGTTMNWVAGGIRELHVTLDSNKTEQGLKFSKSDIIPKSVSTVFVTHCRDASSKAQTYIILCRKSLIYYITATVVQ